MAISAVEARIRSYDNSQLDAISNRAKETSLKIVMGGQLGDFRVTLRVILSAMASLVEHKGSITETATGADMASFVQSMRASTRLDALMGLEGKLAEEKRRRLIYGERS